MAAFEYRITPENTIQIGGGLGYGGRLVVDGVQHEVEPGWVAALAGSWRVVDGGGSKPLVILTLTLGAAGAATRELHRTETASYTAFDVRAGAVVGKTLFDVLTPYAGARVFGGPIFWQLRGEDVLGTDQYHFQMALGLAASLPGDVDVFAEAAPLGERAATVGAGVAF